MASIQFYTNIFIKNLRDVDPDKVIMVANGKSLTADELYNESIKVAYWLQQQGISNGSKVVFAVEPNEKFISYFLGCLLIGATISIIDPEMGEENYKDKFNQFRPDAVFVDSRILLLREHPILKWAVKRMLNKHVPFFPIRHNAILISCGTWLPIILNHKNLPNKLPLFVRQINWIESDCSLPFLITYTSGTIGSPKGVVHSIDTIYSSLHHLTTMLNNDGTTRIAAHLPQYLLLGFISGKIVYLWNNQWSGSRKIKFIGDNNITTLFGPPSDFIPMIDAVEDTSTSPSSLKNIYLGSAPVYPSFLKKIITCFPHTNVRCLYGMTENLLVSSISAQEKLAYNENGDVVGKPFANVEITVADDFELGVSSPQLFIGYFDQELSVRPHLTGDLGLVDKDGNIVLIGRKKDMIIRRNFNIYPSLYEPTINKILNIDAAVLVGVYDDNLAEEVVYLCIESKVKLTSEPIMSKLKSGHYSIDKEALPDRIVFMNLPRSGRQQKINKTELRKILLANQKSNAS